jgi:light-harvesting protein B-800-850 alpha chain
MNNGRLWCVVNPTVGIPLFLGAVALTSLTVHNAVLTHSGWYGNFYKGSAKTTASIDGIAPSAAAVASSGEVPFVVNVTPAAGGTGTNGTSFVITVTPKPVTAAALPASPVDLASSAAK